MVYDLYHLPHELEGLFRSGASMRRIGSMPARESERERERDRSMLMQGERVQILSSSLLFALGFALCAFAFGALGSPYKS